MSLVTIRTILLKPWIRWLGTIPLAVGFLCAFFWGSRALLIGAIGFFVCFGVVSGAQTGLRLWDAIMQGDRGEMTGRAFILVATVAMAAYFIATTLKFWR